MNYLGFVKKKNIFNLVHNISYSSIWVGEKIIYLKIEFKC